MRFEILMTLSVKIQSFCDVTLCTLAEHLPTFRKFVLPSCSRNTLSNVMGLPDREDGSTHSFRNVGKYSPNDTASLSRRQSFFLVIILPQNLN